MGIFSASAAVATAANGFIDEHERMAQRRDIRRQIAEAQLLERKADQRREAIRSIEAELDQEAGKHATAVEPIQSELSDVESRITSKLADRGDVSPKLYARRQELLDKLRDKNTDLETTCRLLNDRRKVLRAEDNRETLRAQGQPSTQSLTNQLASQRLADRQLYLTHFASQQREKFARARVDFAAVEVRKWEGAIVASRTGRPEAPGDESLYASRRDRWRHELNSATSDHQQSVSAMESARAAMVSE